MKHEDSHLSDEQLLLDQEREISPRDEKRVRAHLDACWKCRTHRQELESAIADFARVHQNEFDAKLPPAAGPRALLKAQLGQLSAAERHARASRLFLPGRFAWTVVATLGALLALGVFVTRLELRRQGPARARALVVSLPDSRLTPGATLRVNRWQLCSQESTNNKAVPLTLQRKVFEEYGLTGAEPGAYEVDYLVTPALGGADDIHNLWPHSYAATDWNAHVKDALEDRLHEMVCAGNLDLEEAQQEIAVNWIAAYQRYFHTEKPLAAHLAVNSR